MQIPEVTPGPASLVEGQGPDRFRMPADRPKARWTALLLIVLFALLGVGAAWFFVVPNLPDLPGILGAGEVAPAGQSGSITSAAGITWDLSGDLHSPVELQDVSDNGVALRFLPDPSTSFVATHIVSCEINGTPYNTSLGDGSVRFTVVNESTGESVETLDPYFITSGSGANQAGTVVVVKAEGLAADQYDSLVLGIDQSLTTGDTTEELNGLAVRVTKA